MTPPTEEQRGEILSSLRIGIALDKAARAMGTTAAACNELAGRDPQWAADMAAAEREGKPAEVAPVAVSWADLEKITREREREEAVEAKPAAARAQGAAPDPRAVVPTLAQGEDIPDWQRFADEAEAEFGPGRMGLYLKQDARLVARGEPATSPWWRWTINEYFDSGLTWLIVMAGRGSGKSTTLERFLLSIIMHTRRIAPPSQEWQCAFVSVRPEDARRRVNELQTMLRSAYFIETKVSSGAIHVNDCCANPIEIASMAATIGNVSGASTVCVIIDEAAKLAADGANSDTEMITSLANTSRAREGWAGVRCSSAWQTRGSHFASIIEGTSLANYVARIGPDFIDEALAGYAAVASFEAAQGNSHGAAQIRAFARTITAASPNVPTWVANPTISAMASRMIVETLPPEEGVSKVELWLREAASMPLARDAGPDFAAQCALAAQMTARVTRRPGAQPLTGPMKHPNAEPGDPRYAGPIARPRESGNWRTRKSF